MSNLYNIWKEKATADSDLIAELISIEGNRDEINDRFYRDLEFGTGGLRGVIGAGTNRMNIYSINRATQWLADYVKSKFNANGNASGGENGLGGGSVAIAFDSRIKSDIFAKSAAGVLAANGIKVYIYKNLMPTPMLSYAVRACGCDAGIMVTASHNPAKYNGYKVYGADGCQITLEVAEIVIDKINSLDYFDGAKTSDFDEGIESGIIEYISDDVIENFYGEVLKQSFSSDEDTKSAISSLKVVYTPLNGTGNVPVRTILSRIGVKDITVVPEQENPDGNFSTCPFPNPEITAALDLGLKLSNKIGADILLATDPDCDRVGIAVGGELFSGNEVGALLFEYICKKRTESGSMPKNPVVVKTIVTTDLIFKIAEKYGVEVFETLTGFKFIGEQIGFLEEKGEENRYVFGFEESYGYLAGTYARDKDAVVASMLIIEMAAYYKAIGSSLLQERKRLYAEYGNFIHETDSFQFEGESGMHKMQYIMGSLRGTALTEIAGFKVLNYIDYMGETPLPKSDVLSYKLENGSVIVRPSGTEPKIKVYYTVDSKEMLASLRNEISKVIGE
jgi:phosphoglucomutase